jgi:hypothetical protein
MVGICARFASSTRAPCAPGECENRLWLRNEGLEARQQRFCRQFWSHLVDPLATGADPFATGYETQCASGRLHRRAARASGSEKLIGKQVLQRIAGQPAKSRLRIAIGPSPHHASRPDASKELRSSKPVNTREKSPKYCVFHPVPSARIGAIAGLPHIHPSDPSHRAPHRPLGLPFCYYHGLPPGLRGEDALEQPKEPVSSCPQPQIMRLLSPSSLPRDE